MGQTRQKGVKSGWLVKICQIWICFDSEFSQEFRFNIFQGQLGSLEVKLWSIPSKRGQIGPVRRNVSNIHMFRLRILSKIDIQSYLRSDQVIKSHQRSNLSKTCQKRVQSGCLIQLYALNICFDSEFGREFKFMRPRLVKDCAQNSPILKILLS